MTHLLWHKESWWFPIAFKIFLTEINLRPEHKNKFQSLLTSLHFQSDSSLNSLNTDSATFGNLRQKLCSISSVDCSHNKTQLKLIILMLNHTTFFHEAGDQPLLTLIRLGFARLVFKWGVMSGTVLLTFSCPETQPWSDDYNKIQ